MFFRRKKVQTQPSPDRSVHRTFQIGAILLLIFIFYNIYFNDESTYQSERQIKMQTEWDASKQESAKTEASRIKEELMKDPVFLRMQNFVDKIEISADKKTGDVIRSNGGYLIFYPDSYLQNKNTKEIFGENLMFKISVEPADDKNFIGPKTKN